VFQVDGGPCFLELEDVLAIHLEQVTITGEPTDILSKGQLEAAVANVQTAYWYGVSDHFQLAAKYAFGIAKAHAFLQGNKRTGLVSALVFLGAQGHDISGYSNTALEAATLGIVEDFISTEEFAEYFRHPSLSGLANILVKSLRHGFRELLQRNRRGRDH
jgi:death on curing protein